MFLLNFSQTTRIYWKPKIVMVEIDIANIWGGRAFEVPRGYFKINIGKNRSNALDAKGLTIIKTKNILNLIHSTANKDTALSATPLKIQLR